MDASKQVKPPKGLRYINDEDLSVCRMGSKGRFHYRNASGQPLRDKRLLSRIAHLAIPPAWTDVRICADPFGHIQAIGWDARGRKQYLYHERWSEARNESKFERLADFGRALPRIRKAVSRDLRRKELSREKVLAAIVRLLELSAIRVGNEQYASENGSYGLTTLRNRHVRVNGSAIHLQFRGKSGKEHRVDISHPTIARVVRKCQHLPGQKLFGYLDEQGVHPIASDDVNAYLKNITNDEFTAKDFRTWTGTVLAAASLSRCCDLKPNLRQKQIKEVTKEVAAHLGNTPTICRKSYIHPGVFECFQMGRFPAAGATNKSNRSATGLRAEEKTLLRLLKRLPANKKFDEKNLRVWKKKS